MTILLVLLWITDRYCAHLEGRLWEKYRRNDLACYTPLLVPLPNSRDPSKSALEDPLREAGLLSLTDALEGECRRWLIILDGYDEVQGSSNFVIGNGLAQVKGVKVSHCCDGRYDSQTCFPPSRIAAACV